MPTAVCSAWGQTVSTDVVTGIISCRSEALISSSTCLSVIRNSQMNCFAINALCLVDRNISTYAALGEEATHYKGNFGDTRKEGCHHPARRAVLVPDTRL